MKNENIVIFVIADTEQDYLDYVHRLETKCECLYLNKDGDRKPSNVAKDYSMHPVELHITKFATQDAKNKILFIDYMLELIKGMDLKLFTETEEGVITSEACFISSSC
jgi:hypothetical protein